MGRPYETDRDGVREEVASEHNWNRMKRRERPRERWTERPEAIARKRAKGRQKG